MSGRIASRRFRSQAARYPGQRRFFESTIRPAAYPSSRGTDPCWPATLQSSERCFPACRGCCIIGDPPSDPTPMPAQSLHKPAAILLSLVYVTVGAVGDSLHQLAEQSWSRGAPEHKHREGFFHSHAPDAHWHFHSHTAAKSRSDKGGAPDSGTSLHRVVATHTPHACPLLSLSSVLKIGFAAVTNGRPAPTPSLLRPADRDARVSSTSLRLRLPRGPPAGRLA